MTTCDDAPRPRGGGAGGGGAAGGGRAGETPGDPVPDRWASADRRRVEHGQAGGGGGGRPAAPPMTKDAVAGRIRRLLSMADRKAKIEGIPDTESAVTPDLLEDA